MRVSRIHVEVELRPGELVSLDAGRSHYLLKVLRLRVGAQLRLFDGRADVDHLAVIESHNEAAAKVRVMSVLPNDNESKLRLTLAQALCRGEKMDLVLQKAVELGVHAIQPLVTERTEVQLSDERSAKRRLHWSGVIVSACEQSGRPRLPVLHPVVSLPQWLSAQTVAQLVVLDPFAAQSLRSVARGPAELTLVVGPEGGFSDREQQMFEGQAVQRCSLGPRVLRAETAGLAALAALQFAHGDLA